MFFKISFRQALCDVCFSHGLYIYSVAEVKSIVKNIFNTIGFNTAIKSSSSNSLAAFYILGNLCAPILKVMYNAV